jgi:hypothetical protein
MENIIWYYVRRVLNVNWIKKSILLRICSLKYNKGAKWMLFVVLLQTDNTGNDITKYGGATDMQICWAARCQIFSHREWPTSLCCTQLCTIFASQLRGAGSACPHQVSAWPRPNALAIPQTRPAVAPSYPPSTHQRHKNRGPYGNDVAF